MKIKEYTTELDVDKKNVLREVGHYVIVKEKYNSPQNLQILQEKSCTSI